MNDIKVGVFGKMGCEKSDLTLKFLYGNSNRDYSSDDFVKTLYIDGNPITLTIFDSAGQDEFNEMRFKYYSKIQAAILVFDISNPQSIDTIKSIYNEIQNSDTDSEIQFAVAANKGYLRDQKSYNLTSIDSYKNLEHYFNCKVFETNTKTGKNVEEIFHYVINKTLTLQKNRKNIKMRQNLSSDLATSRKDQRNSQILDKNKIPDPPLDFVKKRSTSIIPTKFSKNTPKNNDSNEESLELFSTSIGDEIKKVLQSRTKQLLVALEEKKQLEIIVNQKNEELQRAYERIKFLESQLKKGNGCS